MTERDTESRPSSDALYVALRRAIVFAVAIFVVVTFLHAMLAMLLFGAVAVILAMAINVPVTWLADHRVHRVIGTLLVELVTIGLFAGVGWFIAPTLADQVTAVTENAPEYIERLGRYVDDIAEEYPIVSDTIDRAQAETAGNSGDVVARIGSITLGIGTALVLLIALFGLVTYAVIDPRPLLRGYLKLFPPRLQDSATAAFTRSSEMVTAWLWSNVIVGGFEAVVVFIVLHLLGVPGATLWAVLAFFAELIPKLGPYIAALPPILVALAESPGLALAVLVFYSILNNFTSNVIDPPVRGRVMRLHPVVLLFAVLAFATTFGFFGALIATPLTGIAAAYVEVFYLSRRTDDEGRLDRYVEMMLVRDAPNTDNGEERSASDSTKGGKKRRTRRNRKQPSQS